MTSKKSSYRLGPLFLLLSILLIDSLIESTSSTGLKKLIIKRKPVVDDAGVSSSKQLSVEVNSELAKQVEDVLISVRSSDTAASATSSISDSSVAAVGSSSSKLSLKDSSSHRSPVEHTSSADSSSSSSGFIKSDPKKPLSCRNHSGEAVDWWFIYQAPNGRRYLYYDSKMAAVNKTDFLPLYHRYKLDDPLTSPILQTIYQNVNSVQQYDDNTVWMGWNDQTRDDRDAFGSSINGSKHAHSKGFFALKTDSTDLDQSVGPDHLNISSFAILTSLPRFPNIQLSEQSASRANYIRRHSLPVDRTKLFGSNFGDNAQHFQCISFEDAREPFDRQHREFIYNYREKETVSFKAFLKDYLETIHPAIVGTNYDDLAERHSIWRQYFSLFKVKEFAQINHLMSLDPAQRAALYSSDTLPIYDSTRRNSRLTHLFPLSASKWAINRNTVKYVRETISLRDSDQMNKIKCYTGTEVDCLRAGQLRSTKTQYQITFDFLAKNPLVYMDIYDDYAALKLVKQQPEKPNAWQIDQRKYGLLVQHWHDPHSLPDHKKTIYDQNDEVLGQVIIKTVEKYSMPQLLETPRRQPVAFPNYNDQLSVSVSSHDHSKWAIGMPLDGDSAANFQPLFCLSDLNRTSKQARLTGKNNGRGGGMFCTSDVKLWSLMMNLNPMAKLPPFANDKLRDLAMQKRLHKLVDESPVPPDAPNPTKLIKVSDSQDDFVEQMRIKKPSTLPKIDFVEFVDKISQWAVNVPRKTFIEAFRSFSTLFPGVTWEGNFRFVLPSIKFDLFSLYSRWIVRNKDDEFSKIIRIYDEYVKAKGEFEIESSEDDENSESISSTELLLEDEPITPKAMTVTSKMALLRRNSHWDYRDRNSDSEESSDNSLDSDTTTSTSRNSDEDGYSVADWSEDPDEFDEDELN